MRKTALTTIALASLLATAAVANEYNKPGFVTEVEEGRLWVFREGSKEYKEFQKTGEPAKQYSDIGSGPDGMTIKAADEQTLKDYRAALEK
jgi:hypothetical protein